MKPFVSLCLFIILCFSCDEKKEDKFHYIKKYGVYERRYTQSAKEYEKAVDKIGLIMNDTINRISSKNIADIILEVNGINQTEELIKELATVKQNGKSLLYYLFKRANDENIFWRDRLHYILALPNLSYEAGRIIFSANYDFESIDTLTIDWGRVDVEFHRWVVNKEDTSNMSQGRRNLLIELAKRYEIYSGAKPHTKISMTNGILELLDQQEE
ncbi:MAG: hypothetical protein RIG77_24255 [Cyclobacteriaceae bacterium]